MLPSNQTELNLETAFEYEMKDIPGLNYICDYISIEQQQQLLNNIDQQQWETRLKRRVQHYGYRYDYKNGSLSSSSYLGLLPDWLQSIANRFCTDGLTSTVSDQVIVNEYEPGQGITSHIDCVPCFGNTILILSLGSKCVMDFSNPQTAETASLLLLPGSVLVLQKAARYEWMHGIAARKKDKYQGQELVRTRRVSMTFREVFFPYK